MRFIFIPTLLPLGYYLGFSILGGDSIDFFETSTIFCYFSADGPSFSGILFLGGEKIPNY